MVKISHWIHQISTGRVAFAALVLFLLFVILVLPGQASKAAGETKSAGSPDMSFFYSQDDLYRMAEAYGENGREAYIEARFTFDLVWPIVYMIFLCTNLSWIYRRAFAPTSQWQRLNLVPIFALLFDYLENISTSLVMGQYPNQIPLVAALAPVFTIGKWILVGGSFILLYIGTCLAAWRWIKRKNV
jgi:hypothetical protein